MVLQISDLDEALAGEAEAETIRDRVLGAVGLEGKASSNEETFWATRRLLEALARERPLVVVLEDVHWAEPALLDLIEHVSRVVGRLTDPAPVPVPAGADRRPAPLGGWAGERGVDAVLEPLTAAECDELIGLILDGAELAPELRARINEAAEGNPLFIEQMLAMVAEQGTNGGTLRSRRRSRRCSLRGSSISGSSSAARSSGRRSWDGTSVARRWSTSPHEVRSVRSAARSTRSSDSSSLRPVRDEGFRFRHLLLLEVAYDSVPKGERAELHERFAEWLEGEGEEQEEVAGHHFERAYSYRAELGSIGAAEQALARRAATRLGAAGRRAYERGDLQAAVGSSPEPSSCLEPGAAGRVELASRPRRGAPRDGRLRPGGRPCSARWSRRRGPTATACSRRAPRSPACDCGSSPIRR